MRSRLHLVVDITLFLLFSALVATGLLMTFVLPPGSGGATVWGWTRHDWGSGHFWIALAMLAAIVVHLSLNWAWVCTVAGKWCGRGKLGTRRRVALGILALVVTVGTMAGFLLAANSAREEGTRGGGWQRHARQSLSTSS